MNIEKVLDVEHYTDDLFWFRTNLKVKFGIRRTSQLSLQ